MVGNAIYNIMSEILVPKTILRQGEILRYDAQTLRRKMHAIVPLESKITTPFPSPSLGRHHVTITAEDVNMIRRTHKKNTLLLGLRRYRHEFMKVISTLISVDILIISAASGWLRFVSRRHGIYDVRKFDRDSDEEESSSDDEVGNDEEKGKHNAIQTNTLNRKTRRHKKSHNKKKAIMSILMLEEHGKRHQMEQRRISKARAREESTVRFSSYNELCGMVEHKLHTWKRIPCFFAKLLAWSGMGHTFTRVGRIHWKIVRRKYWIFGCACFGIWTDEIVDSYNLEEIAETIFIDNDTETNYTKLLYISIGICSILFQALQSMTFASVVISSVSDTPLFVYSKRLHDKLPKMFVWNAWEKAIEKEVDLNHNSALSVITVYSSTWILYLYSCSIWMTESRALGFVANLLGVSLSFMVLIYSDSTRPLIILILVLLFPFALAKALLLVIVIGKRLNLTDADFIEFGRNVLWLLSLTLWQPPERITPIVSFQPQSSDYHDNHSNSNSMELSVSVSSGDSDNQIENAFTCDIRSQYNAENTKLSRASHLEGKLYQDEAKEDDIDYFYTSNNDDTSQSSGKMDHMNRQILNWNKRSTVCIIAQCRQ